MVDQKLKSKKLAQNSMSTLLPALLDRYVGKTIGYSLFVDPIANSNITDEHRVEVCLGIEHCVYEQQCCNCGTTINRKEIVISIALPSVLKTRMGPNSLAMYCTTCAAENRIIPCMVSRSMSSNNGAIMTPTTFVDRHVNLVTSINRNEVLRYVQNNYLSVPVTGTTLEDSVCRALLRTLNNDDVQTFLGAVVNSTNRADIMDIEENNNDSIDLDIDANGVTDVEESSGNAQHLMSIDVNKVHKTENDGGSTKRCPNCRTDSCRPGKKRRM
jgi:hypothetical protein